MTLGKKYFLLPDLKFPTKLHRTFLDSFYSRFEKHITFHKYKGKVKVTAGSNDLVKNKSAA